jgi:hypothetical protein
MKPKQKLANIENISFLKYPNAGLETTLVIKGYLSDPAWEFNRESLDIDETTNKITVRIWVKRDPTLMAAQVTKNFVKEIKITVPHSGKWKIQVNDKNLEIEVE